MIRYLAAVIMYMVLAVPAVQGATADAYEHGMPGMKWGAKMSFLFNLKEISQEGDVRYYVKYNEDFTIKDITPEKVVYGFYKDQLFAAFLHIDTKAQFDVIRRYIVNSYGATRAQLRVDQTTYIWSRNNIKIKMKSYGKDEKYKVGFYYTPLSAKVNESRLEEGFEKVFPLVPDGDK